MVPTRLFACPLLLTAALAAQADLRADVEQALDRARPALLAHLRAADDITTRTGELALLLLAAIHDGVPAIDPIVESALRNLAGREPDQTYDCALRLLVLEASPQLAKRLELAKADAKELLRHRAANGAFHYGRKPVGWDLSNTQYAALGLRAAVAMGVPVGEEVWRKMARAIAAEQGSYGEFSYAERDRHGAVSHASMTAAGIAVLAICRQQLPGAETGIDRGIARGWQWFERNAASVGSLREHWSYYFHYGLERAAILCDVETIGNVDWYATGARMLIDAQRPGGGWVSDTDGYRGPELGVGRGNSVPTAFAVLFLRRKFQKTIGPITPHIVTLAAVGPMSKQKDIDACAAELVRRGKTAMPDVLKALRSEIEPQRRAAAAALVGIAGEGFGYDPTRDAAANTDAVRKAELWYLRTR